MEVWDYRRNVIEHHGIKGQKWGIRRYQNPDGSLTELGRKRIQQTYDKVDKMYTKMANKADKKAASMRRKGKSGKEQLYNTIADDFRRARAEKLKRIGDMTFAEFKKSKKSDRFMWLYSQQFLSPTSKSINDTSKLSRFDNRIRFLGNRITIATTFDATLKRIDPDERYRYIDTKRQAGGSGSYPVYIPQYIPQYEYIPVPMM